MSDTVAFTPVATSNENAETGAASPANPTRPEPAHGMSAGGGDAPTTGTFEDFQRGFGEALGEIREEEDGAAPAARVSGGSDAETPLWQQDRRQSRNMMWL